MTQEQLSVLDALGMTQEQLSELLSEYNLIKEHSVIDAYNYAISKGIIYFVGNYSRMTREGM